MADYRSSLTGTQMDSALLDMAEHNSEAYAVGERNGIAVAPDDVTYHNNARYYAQIASSQIVGDASSAVRWDTDQSEVLTDAQKAQARENINAASDSDVVKITSQTLTSAEQAQARANIAAGGSNPNLLDNPWFTVNQRGRSSYNSAGYSVDRWLSNGTQQVTVSSAGVTLGEQGYRFVQRMENPSIFAGKTLTISAKTNAANVRFAYWDSTSDYNNGSAITVPVVDGYASLTINITNGIYAIGLSTASGTGGLYRAMKLELGSVSTLANDAPPDYGEELAKCMRYFQRLNGFLAYIGSGYCDDTSNAYFICPLSVPLRSGVTVSLSYSGVYLNSNSIQAVTGLVVLRNPTSYTTGGIALKATASGLTAKAPALLQIRAENGYIDLSADL